MKHLIIFIIIIIGFIILQIFVRVCVQHDEPYYNNNKNNTMNSHVCMSIGSL